MSSDKGERSKDRGNQGSDKSDHSGGTNAGNKKYTPPGQRDLTTPGSTNSGGPRGGQKDKKK